MQWIFLGLSILLEVVGTVLLKLSNGFTRPLPSVGMGLAYVTSIAIFNFAVKSIPMGMAYAIWAGAGTASIALIGFLFFGEIVTTIKIVSLCLIIAGCVGLNLAGGH
jgi:small multidrug resistance pump